MVEWDDGWGTWEGPDRNEPIERIPTAFSCLGINELFLNGEKVQLGRICTAKRTILSGCIPCGWELSFTSSQYYEPGRYKVHGFINLRKVVKVWFGSSLLVEMKHLWNPILPKGENEYHYWAYPRDIRHVWLK